MSEPERVQVTGQWRKLNRYEHHDFNCLISIQVNKSRRITGQRQTVWTGGKKKLVQPEGRRNLRDAGLEKSTKLKLVFKCECGPDSSASG